MRHRSPTLSLCGSLVVLVATLASPHAVAQTTGPVRHGTPQSLLRVTFDRTIAETNRTLIHKTGSCERACDNVYQHCLNVGAPHCRDKYRSCMNSCD